MAAVELARNQDSEAPFRIRGTTVNLVTLQINQAEPAIIIEELGRLLKQAPAFLRNAPIIIGLDSITAEAKDVDFPGLIGGLRGLDLFPIGVTGGRVSVREAAAAAGLPIMPKGSMRGGDLGSPEPAPVTSDPPPAEDPTAEAVAERQPPELPMDEPATAAEAVPADAPTVADASAADVSHAAPAVLITTPVRAGRQIYANKGADLIVTATVNAGAEIFADGNIHIYGALRGRAIAGAGGYEGARIFAQEFDPELVAIAGLYRVREDLDPGLIGKGIQLRLDGEGLRFDALGPAP
ncbi:MAG: septum site-determining protein MinC [Alphaproteobacteria bacterium]|nr:septum site-determining protein MinC [Alphaproteobacteria bacterium]